MAMTGTKMLKKKAKHGGSGAPRMVTDGADLSPNAKNVIKGTKVSTKPLAPNANKLACKGHY